MRVLKAASLSIVKVYAFGNLLDAHGHRRERGEPVWAIRLATYIREQTENERVFSLSLLVGVFCSVVVYHYLVNIYINSLGVES